MVPALEIEVPTHFHTKFPSNDTCTGEQSILEIARAANDWGYAGVVFSEHSSDPGAKQPIPDTPLLRGWFEARVAQIAEAHGETGLFLQDGLEINLTRNGAPDIEIDWLPPSFYVVASQHGGLGDSEKDSRAIAQRLDTASSNPRIDAIGHPSRYNDDVKGVDWPKILAQLQMTSTLAEVNLNCFWKTEGSIRFWFHWLRHCANSGVPIVIGYDNHNEHMWPDTDYGEEWFMPVGALEGLLGFMDGAGIPRSQIVNSTLEAWSKWVEIPKLERHTLVSW